jgi:spermidine synthase
MAAGPTWEAGSPGGVQRGLAPDPGSRYGKGMLPWKTIERARAPDGTELVLARRGAEWVVRAGGRTLMSSRQHGSEEALGALALGRAARLRTILLGGLGLGFTLRAVLDRAPASARVVVAELAPALAAWNRGPVAELAGRPLEDPRVRLQLGDVHGRIAEARGAFDAILLDVDNGPSALAHGGNDRLYGMQGVRACRDALADGGVLATWSAGPDERYLARLGRAGLEAEARAVPAREGDGARHVVFLAVKGAGARPARRRGP